MRGLFVQLGVFVLAALCLARPAVAAPPPGRGKPPTTNGKFDVVVSGYYRGGGTAVASKSNVSIQADLKDESGGHYKLTATSLPRDPDRSAVFRGAGTLDGMEVRIDGRVDAPDDDKREVLKNGRIVFTFKVANGRHGRGVGTGGVASPGTGNKRNKEDHGGGPGGGQGNNGQGNSGQANNGQSGGQGNNGQGNSGGQGQGSGAGQGGGQGNPGGQGNNGQVNNDQGNAGGNSGGGAGDDGGKGHGNPNLGRSRPRR